MKKLCIVLCLLLAGVASADGLLQNTTPAERMRGASWADHFRSQASVEDTGGTVTGAPTFSLDGGVTLDGSADYLTYNLMGTEFNSDPISIVVEFTPDFATNEDAGRYFFDSTAANRYFILKLANASSNQLQIQLGNTFIANITEATYSPYWAVGNRNVLVVSGTTGDTSVWLNGNEILSSDASAWTAKEPTEFYVGCSNAAAGKFDGTIHSLRVFKAKLTAAEALDYYDHSTYKYMESATAVYQMRAEDHDPTNNRTLDTSGNAYHIADVSDPVKLTTHGYTYDGANDYHNWSDDGTFEPAGDFSIQLFIKPTLGASGYIAGKWESAGDHRSWVVYLNTSGTMLLYISDDGTADGGHQSFAQASSVCAVGRPAFVTATYDYVADGTSVGNVYVEDMPAGTNSSMDGPANPPTSDFVIGARNGGNGKYPGDVYQIIYYDNTVLTPLQIKDAQMTAWKGLQRP